jgi:hypothetical protein
MDFDYADDIKIFVNLSDTSASDGPLEYIVATNNAKFKKIWTDGFIQDEQIEQLYSANDTRFLVGERGTVHLCNNRGIHRDSPPDKDHWKLGFQICMSRSIYGSEELYGDYRLQLNPAWPSYEIWSIALEKDPNFYGLLFRQR